MTTLPLVPTPPATSKPTKPTKLTQTAQQAGATPRRIMGEAGPQRLFSPNKFEGGQVYESPTLTGYAGAYYCDGCMQPVGGVYCVVGVVDRWLCAACGGQKAARKAMANTYSASAAPKMGNVVTMPSRTGRTAQERSPRRRKARTRSM